VRSVRTAGVNTGFPLDGIPPLDSGESRMEANGDNVDDSFEIEEAMMPNLPVIVHIALILIIIGVVLSLVNRFIPMASSIRSILNAVVVICVLVWLLNVFGLLSSVPSFPKIRNP
jgi:hypothetical protein